MRTQEAVHHLVDLYRQYRIAPSDRQEDLTANARALVDGVVASKRLSPPETVANLGRLARKVVQEAEPSDLLGRDEVGAFVCRAGLLYNFAGVEFAGLARPEVLSRGGFGASIRPRHLTSPDQKSGAYPSRPQVSAPPDAGAAEALAGRIDEPLQTREPSLWAVAANKDSEAAVVTA